MAKAATVYDPTLYNEWADRQLQPGDKGDPARALARRIKMHEFIMTGGIQIAVENGIVTYGPPVDPATTPVCPWHGEGCTPWEEIVAGRGHGSFDGPTLRELRERTPEEIAEAKRMDDIEKVKHDHPGLSRSSAKAAVESEDAFQAKRAEQRAQFDSRTAPQDRFGANREAVKEHRALSGGAHRTEEKPDLGTSELADAAAGLADEITFDGDEDEPEVSGNDEQEGN